MCTLLADFLRTSLSLGARGRVSLDEEIGLAERYLAIEQVRFGERLQVSRSVEPEVAGCLVPPLLVQPLIENAVKHGVADQVEGGTVRIAARRRGELLEVEVENSRDPEAPPRRGAGMGLDNVKRRLEAIAADQGKLVIDRAERSFRVTLTLPAEFEASR
jgi:LytS/YehU family sensor histidine kinase